MSPELKTSRLCLRQIGVQDLDTIFFMRSDPGINRYIKRELAQTLSDAEKWLERILQNNLEQKSFNWTITFAEEGKMLGSICLWNFSPDRTVAELGYDLHPRFHGQGIMSEAVDAVIKFGFGTLQLKSIEAFTSRHNAASTRLLERKGFKPHANRKDDDNADNVIYLLSP